jgi:hypothetical protein
MYTYRLIITKSLKIKVKKGGLKVNYVYFFKIILFG